MAKPYALSLYGPVIDTSPGFEAALTQTARGWKRSIRNMGGCWQGSFTLFGEATTLQDRFRRWLGYDLRERAGGITSWRGLIYEMDLTINQVTRRRSLDLIWNRIKTTYLTQDFVGENFVGNPGFEEYDASGPPVDDFYGWYESGGGGQILAAAGAHGGAACVRLDGDGTQENVWLRQNLNVTPGATYQLKFWTKGDGGISTSAGTGRFAIRNPNAPTYWVYGPMPTMWGSGNWTERKIEFSGPSEGEILLFFYAPTDNTRTAYFDDVEVLEKQETVYETPWAELDGSGNPAEAPDNSPPIERYGVREEVIHLDGYPEETSLAYRDTYLRENAWPWPRPVATGRGDEARLDVLVAGYVHTMNWMYVEMGDGADDDVDAWISLIVGDSFGRDAIHGGTVVDAGDCQWVRNGVIRPNDYLSTPNGPLQATQLTGVEERPWDVLQELTALGDYDGNPWRIWVRLDRQVNYEPVDIDPRYFIRRDGIFDTMAGSTPSNPWTMQPGVFRDMTYRPAAVEPGSFLNSPQDMFVDEVEMADGWDQPALKTSIFSEAELLLHEPSRGESEGPAPRGRIPPYG